MTKKTSYVAAQINYVAGVLREEDPDNQKDWVRLILIIGKDGSIETTEELAQ